MAITPRSKGLGNIGAIVNREGRASPAMKAPVKPVAVSKPAPKPVAKVAPKPAPKLAAKPSPFKPNTRAPGGQPEIIELQPPRSLGQGAPSPIDRSQIGGAQRVGGSFDRPIYGGEPGRGPGFITQPMDQFIGQQPMFGEPGVGNFNTMPINQFIGQQPVFGEPGVGNFNTMPINQFSGQQPMFGEPNMGGFTTQPMMPQGSLDYNSPSPSENAFLDPNINFGESAPYTGGMMSPRRVINQVGKPGFQPRPNMSNAFNPNAVSDYDQLEGPGYNTGGGGFMGGSGSMFGGGGFSGR
jgi:hypothetical protein